MARVLVFLSLLLATNAAAYDAQELQGEMTGGVGGTTAVDEAKDDFEAGVRLYREGKYRLARIKFQASYDLSHSADLLHNLSMVAEMQGLLADALAFEEQFFAAKGGNLDQVERDQCVGRLARLRSFLNLTAVPKPPARRIPVGGIVLASIGVGFLAVGIGTGVAALGLQQDAANGQFTLAEYDELLGRGRTLSSTATAFYVVGGLSVAAGTAWALAVRFGGDKK